MTVFGRIYADAYDALYAAKDYAGDCDMIELLLAEFGTVRPIRQLLDLGCGTGGHAIALAARGYEVTGIDFSRAMLARAHQKAMAEVSREVVFHEGDIRRARLADAPYDGAIMMFAVLGYQRTDADVRAAVANAHAHLVTGGALVFDIWYGPGVLAASPGPRRRVVETPTGRIVRCAESIMDETRHLCTVDYKVERWNENKLVVSAEEQHVMRFFFPQELQEIATDCGFACCAVRRFPDWRVSADADNWSAVCVFRAV
jgi:SAM-dependent methyltransferase